MLNSSKKTLTNSAIAAAMAVTIIGSSLSAAEAGRSERRIIGLGIVGALIGAAIVNESYRSDRHYYRECWWEKRRRWSKRKGRYVWRKVKFCD